MERVKLNGADIEYDVRGSGEPVVFIHGAILSDGFVPVIEQTGGGVKQKIGRTLNSQLPGFHWNLAAATPALCLRPRSKRISQGIGCLFPF